MFFLSMPNDFKVGQSAECRINGRPARVTWQNQKTLVIEPDDARSILSVTKDGDLLHFTCGDSGKGITDYGSLGPIIYEKPESEVQAAQDVDEEIPSNESRFYWLSIEGCGSAILPMALTRQEMLQQWANAGWADQLIGLPTAEEQRRLHRICLTAPIPAVEEEMARLAPKVEAREVEVVTPPHSRFRCSRQSP